MKRENKRKGNKKKRHVFDIKSLITIEHEGWAKELRGELGLRERQKSMLQMGLS